MVPLVDCPAMLILTYFLPESQHSPQKQFESVALTHTVATAGDI